MKFGIVILHERKRFRLQVELIEDNGVMAKYKVTARNDMFVLQTNKPLLTGKRLKHKKATWKVIEGGHHRVTIIELIVKEIEKKLL